jgi:lipoyl(octanoyl) transferase
MRLRRQEGPASVANESTPASIVDLGLTDYVQSYQLQQQLVEKRRDGSLESDLFLVTEHPATFTLGRRGGRQNLMVSEDYLNERNIPVVHIERGGDITFHGPGQLVIYPIFHLRGSLLNVAEYVQCLEEVMVRLAAVADVTALRDQRNHGVWAGGRKLGSIGIAIRHGIAFHGLALNVNIALGPFSWVNPCGLTGVSMTSLSEVCGRDVSTVDMKKKLRPILEDVFNRSFTVAARGVAA